MAAFRQFPIVSIPNLINSFRDSYPQSYKVSWKSLLKYIPLIRFTDRQLHFNFNSSHETKANTSVKLNTCQHNLMSVQSSRNTRSILFVTVTSKFFALKITDRLLRFPSPCQRGIDLLSHFVVQRSSYIHLVCTHQSIVFILTTIAIHLPSLYV